MSVSVEQESAHFERIGSQVPAHPKEICVPVLLFCHMKNKIVSVLSEKPTVEWDTVTVQEMMAKCMNFYTSLAQ